MERSPGVSKVADAFCNPLGWGRLPVRVVALGTLIGILKCQCFIELFECQNNAIPFLYYCLKINAWEGGGRRIYFFNFLLPICTYTVIDNLK